MSSSSSVTMSTSFKVPSEPCPLPSLGSDEESFVVLGKSLTSDFELSPTENDNSEPVGNSIIQEAKQLISRELSQMENSDATVVSDKGSSGGEQSCKKETDVVDVGGSEGAQKEMEQSTALPQMPNVVKNFNEDTTNTPISIMSFTASDLASEETQGKIAEIIDENVQLKNTILQNNASMKSQYERIVAWQEDVQRVHESHKHKFLEAKQYIEMLKQDNYSLKQALEKEKENRDALEIEISMLKNIDRQKQQKSDEKLVQTSDNNLKEFELEIANNKIKELESALEETKIKLMKYENVDSELGLMATKLEEARLENIELSEQNKELRVDHESLQIAYNSIDKLQRDIDSLNLDVEKHNEEMTKLRHEENEKRRALEEEIISLRAQLASAAQQRAQPLPSPNLEETAALRHQLMNMQVSLTQCEHSRVAACALAEDMRRQVAEMKQQAAVVQMEKDDMFALKAQLDVYKADFEAERQAKEEVKTQNVKLTEDLQHLQRRNQQLQEEIEHYRERDYVHVPRSYTNYNTGARRSREGGEGAASGGTGATAGGNTRFTFRCPTCNVAYHTLEALESHTKRCVVSDYTSRHHFTTSSSTPNPVYKCPKCSFGFHTVQALENHVYRCIDLDDQLP